MLTGPRIIAGRRPLEIVRLIGVSALQGPSYAAGAAEINIDTTAGARRAQRAAGVGGATIEVAAGARRTRRLVGQSATTLSAAGSGRRTRRANGAAIIALAASASAQSVDPWVAAALARMSSPPVAFIERLDAGARILRAAGVLERLDVLYLCGSYSQASARLNLCSSSFPLTEVNSPTWTAWASSASPGGYTGGGTAYLDTGANPSTQFTRAGVNSASYGTWVSSELANAGFSAGDLAGTLMLVQPRSATNSASARVNDTLGLAVGTATSLGLTAGDRSGASARNLYRNGVSIGSDTQAASALPATMYLLRRSSTYYPGQISAAFAGASMTASQHLALYRGIATMLGISV